MIAFKTITSVILTVGLTACASLAQEQQPAPLETEEPRVLQAPPLKPEYRLVPDLVNSILIGELATQRQRYAEAHKEFLYAARLARSQELAELATKTALAAKDQDGARAAVTYWLELDAKDLNALQIAALIEAQGGHLEAAVDKLRQLVAAHNAGPGSGYMLVAGLLGKMADRELRLKLMRLLVGEGSQDPDALFALAALEAGIRHYAEAETLAREVLGLRPDWSEAKAFLVRMLTEQDRKKEAREALENYLRQSPDDGLLRASYARLLLEQEDLAAARDQFQRLLQAKPGDEEILFALGVLSLELKDLAAARGHFETLFAGRERRDEAAYYLGQVEEQAGAKDKALVWYQKVEGKRRFEAQVRAARLRARLGDLRLAREMLQQLRGQLADNDLELALAEAEILREAMEYPAAMEVLDQALARHPNDHDLLYARALLAVPMGRIEILERDLQQILKEDPNHADALNALGYTLADQTDRYQEALGYVERALAQKPDSPAFLDSMGWLQYRLGNRDQALDYLRRALKLLPDAEIAAHLGEVLWTSGQRDAATQVWTEALNRDPDSEHIRGVMERFKDK